jgi:hypothetical protein
MTQLGWMKSVGMTSGVRRGK